MGESDTAAPGLAPNRLLSLRQADSADQCPSCARSGACATSLLVYIFALGNKAVTYLDRWQGGAFTSGRGAGTAVGDGDRGGDRG